MVRKGGLAEEEEAEEEAEEEEEEEEEERAAARCSARSWRRRARFPRINGAASMVGQVIPRSQRYLLPKV